MIRIVYKTSYDAHTYPIFNELEILPFNKIYLFHLVKCIRNDKCNDISETLGRCQMPVWVICKNKLFSNEPHNLRVTQVWYGHDNTQVNRLWKNA
jgi:hypothetical protein